MAGDDVSIGVGPRNKDDYRKVNVDERSVNSGDLGGDVITSRLPVGGDYFAVTYPSSTQEVYTFRKGGVAGTVMGILTLNYTDSTKENLLNGAWT